MIKLTREQVETTLQNPQFRKAVDEYRWIQGHVQQSNVSQDSEFQRRFTRFYRIRRDAKWRHHYFSLMEKEKNSDPAFDGVLHRLRQQTGRVEASFASKLVATLNPSRPVIDRIVLSHFGLRLPYHPYVNDREIKAVQVYSQLRQKYDELMTTKTTRMILDSFNAYFGSEHITDLKKIDLVLWQTRSKKPPIA